VKLQFQTRVVEDVTVLECLGRITYRLEAAALEEKMADLAHDNRQFVLDLSRVEMIDSAGLGELVHSLVSVRSRQGSIKLASPSPRIRSLFSLTNLSAVLEIYPSLEDALLAYRAQAA
jgi:anti-sigma B factor antagonist